MTGNISCRQRRDEDGQIGQRHQLLPRKGGSNMYRFFILCLISGILWIAVQQMKTNTYFFSSLFKDALSRAEMYNNIQHERWIVITTVAPPTPDVQYLAKIPGWKVVVVGDKKTPSNWSYDHQRHLGYDTSKWIPMDSYSRKNIGYLFAIEHGAKIIYETDDDNRPLDQLANFIYGPLTSGLMFNGTHLFNPYRHFGQPTFWPRGYPLEHITEKATLSYNLHVWRSPLIQQGLVNGDPDMDAVFRLTRKEKRSILNVTFDIMAPNVILPKGSFAPFNTQNTLHFYDAFWALMIPVTVTFRVCDIWRAYWAQRLLWEIGGSLGFIAPNAFQKRNSHSYIKDAYEETDLYFKAEKLILYLLQWSCPVYNSLFECAILLSDNMAESGFWGSKDVDLTKSWLSDLKNAGYQEPGRKSFSVSTFVKYVRQPDLFHLSTFNTSEIPLSVQYSALNEQPDKNNLTKMRIYSTWKAVAKMSKMCPDTNFRIPEFVHTGNYTQLDNILLVIVFNHPYYENVEMLEALYSLHFPQRLYCGPNFEVFQVRTGHLDNAPSFVQVAVGNGSFSYKCALAAMYMQYHVSGYLIIGDDTLLNSWLMIKEAFPMDKIWINKPHMNPLLRNEPYECCLLESTYSISALTKSLSELKSYGKAYKKYRAFIRANSGSLDGFYKAWSDIVFVPASYVKRFLFLMNIFAKHLLFHELAYPTAFYGIEKAENIFNPPGTYLWGKDRGNVSMLFNSSELFLHPVKLANIKNDQERRHFYCETIFPLMLS